MQIQIDSSSIVDIEAFMQRLERIMGHDAEASVRMAAIKALTRVTLPVTHDFSGATFVEDTVIDGGEEASDRQIYS